MTAPTATVEGVAQEHQAEQAARARDTAKTLLASWAAVDLASIAASWLALLAAGPMAILVAAQLLAARRGARYVQRAVEALGVRADPLAAVLPERFAGAAADGRRLDVLLYQPAITTLQAIRAGADVRRAHALGGVQLDMIVRTEVADAGRVATGTAITVRPGIGWVRMLNPPSCSRCVILAGRFYAWNDGFERHPRCDCVHVPSTEDTADDLRTGPKAYFDNLDEAEQNRVFTHVGAEAVRDGASLVSVVNARRGMYTAGGRLLTTEGTRRGRARLMPEQIYIEAGADRDEALRLLRLHGYIR